MPSFKAGTQYGDWKGSSAADCYQGSTEMDAFLTKKGLLAQGETCIAISLGVGENQPGREMTVYASAFLVKGQNINKIQAEFDSISDPFL